jgi:phosphoribosylamine---glycine ligase
MDYSMRILFVSGELIGSGLALRLKDEGHEIKLYIDDPARKNCLTGFIEKTNDWKGELQWVGKDGLIVFDDVGFGRVQERLRAQGYAVFGGNAIGDRLEHDRAYAQRILRDAGMQVLPMLAFKSVDSAIAYVRTHKGKWVAKQSTHISVLNHVGTREDGSDVIRALERFKEHGIDYAFLQRRIDGVEVAISRYFNGKDWVGPIAINHEHKRLKNGDKGPLTAEMGTVIWHTEDERLPLFKETLKRMKPFLRKIDYRGHFDINSIVTESAVWPLEITPRIPTPAIELQCELYTSSMAELLSAVARQKQTKVIYKDEMGIVASVAVPPFPYPPARPGVRKDRPFRFKKQPKKNQKHSIYLEEISKREKKGGGELYWAGENGYVGYVTASTKSIPRTRKKILSLLQLIDIKGIMYRTDIGERVHKHDLPQLRKWSWL